MKRFFSSSAKKKGQQGDGRKARRSTFTQSKFHDGSLGFRLLKTMQNGGFKISEIIDSGQASGFGYSVGDTLVGINDHTFEEEGTATIEAVLELLKSTDRPVNLKIKSTTAPKPQKSYKERQSVLEL